MNIDLKKSSISLGVILIIVLATYLIFIGNPFKNVLSSSTNETIKFGDRDGLVFDLQRKLLELGYFVTVDGIFGAETEQALLTHTGKNEITENELNRL